MIYNIRHHETDDIIFECDVNVSVFDTHDRSIGNVVMQAKKEGVGMRWANLAGANLQGFDLTGMDFSNSILTGSDLSHSNLTGANLRCADMIRTSLYRTNLTNADLTCTDFYGATLNGAITTNALFDCTAFFGAILEGSDVVFCGSLPDEPIYAVVRNGEMWVMYGEYFEPAGTPLRGEYKDDADQINAIIAHGRHQMKIRGML